MAAVILLSGCTAKSETTTASLVNASAQVDDDTGGIEGSVVDQEDLPVTGATVGIIGMESLSAVTDEAGFFSFSHIAPGRYSLQVVNTGYDDAIEWVEVVAGEVTSGLAIKIVKIAIVEPYHETALNNGLFGCGLSWRPGIIYSGVAVCGLLGLAGEAGADTSPYDKFAIGWQVKGPIAGWNASALEMQWTSTQLLGKGLSMIWEMGGCLNEDNREGVLTSTAGRSPLRNVTAPGKMDKLKKDPCVSEESCLADSCAIGSRVFATPETFGPTSPADVGINVQQPFTQFHTAFFFAPAPPDYTAIS